MKSVKTLIALYKSSPQEFLKYFKNLFDSKSETKKEHDAKIDLFANVINIICEDATRGVGGERYVENLFLNSIGVPKACELIYYEPTSSNSNDVGTTTTSTTYFAQILKTIGLEAVIKKLSMQSIYVLHEYNYIIYYILHYYLLFFGGKSFNHNFSFRFGKNGEEINYALYLFLYLSKEDKHYLSKHHSWITKKHFFMGKCVTKISEELNVDFNRAKTVIANFLDKFP
jgi:hypothetical protein